MMMRRSVSSPRPPSWLIRTAVGAALLSGLLAAGADPGVPGLAVPEAESREIYGGQCAYEQVYCFQGSQNCTLGLCYLNQSYGSPGQARPAVNSICMNIYTGGYCCTTGGVVDCVNP